MADIRYQKNTYVQDLELATARSGFFAEFPLFQPLFSVIPIPALRHLAQARGRLTDYGKVSIARYKKSLAADPLRSRPTLFTKMLESGTTKDSLVEREAANFILAGSDTTAITLTYLVWTVLGHPEIHRKVLAAAQILPENFSSDDIETKAPYINWVIEETLRLYGAAPSSLPRVVPSGGRDLVGYFVPADTVVCTQSYTVHRDPNVFQDPLRLVIGRLNPYVTCADLLSLILKIFPRTVGESYQSYERRFSTIWRW